MFLDDLKTVEYQTHCRGIDGTCGFLIAVSGKVFIGISDPGIHPGDVLDELFDMLELCPSPGQNNPRDQLLFLFLVSLVLDFEVNLVDDFHNPGMDDFREVLQGNFLGLPSP